MSHNIVLLANDLPGIAIARYLIERKENILRLYLHEKKSRKYGEEIIHAARVKPEQIFVAKDLKYPKHIKKFHALKPDFIITVYWKWLLSKEILSCAQKGNVNFHPALLPIGRGWFPHVHSLINGTPTGVTLHVMDENADTGPILAQRKGFDSTI